MNPIYLTEIYYLQENPSNILRLVWAGVSRCKVLINFVL